MAGSDVSDGGIIKQLGMYVRTKSDSGKKLTDQEILQQIKVRFQEYFVANRTNYNFHFSNCDSYSGLTVYHDVASFFIGVFFIDFLLNTYFIPKVTTISL